MEPGLAPLFVDPIAVRINQGAVPEKMFNFFPWQKAGDCRECSRKIARLGGKHASKTADLTNGNGR